MNQREENTSILRFLQNRLFRASIPQKTVSGNPVDVYQAFTCIEGRATLALFLSVCLLVLPCAAMGGGKKKPPERPVNINTANSEELQQVPGIGPATAQKILQMRKSYGPFRSVDDLLAIRGLGEKRLNKMRKYLTIGKATTPKNAAPAQAAVAPLKPPDKTTEKP